MPDELITKIEETNESVSADSADLTTVLGRESGFAKKRFSEAVLSTFMETLDRASKGSNLAYYQLKEAMVTADFPYLFGDVLDRSLLGQWNTTIPNWKSFVKTGTVRDFRPAKLYGIVGMGAVLPAVGERAEYQERGPSEETPITRQVSKYGARFGISFETVINDDLGALSELPQRLVMAARRTEALAVTNLYVGSAGPNTSVFANGNYNLVNPTCGASATNPALSVAGLADAFRVLANQKDVDGFPIVIDAVTLVCGPQLEVTAENILNATELMVATGGGNYNAQDQLRVRNWMNNKLNLTIDPYIGMVASSNQATSWWLFASSSSPRAGLQVDYLAGHESPELFVRSPNASRVGGGTVAESFETDEQQFKVRHIFGSVVIDPKAAVASNGTGS
jgi:hypothetical protein